MLVLVAVGVMQPWWMVAVATVVLLEKALPAGPHASRWVGLLVLPPGLVLMLAPGLSLMTS